jgi:hypothetical protein
MRKSYFGLTAQMIMMGVEAPYGTSGNPSTYTSTARKFRSRRRYSRSRYNTGVEKFITHAAENNQQFLCGVNPEFSLTGILAKAGQVVTCNGCQREITRKRWPLINYRWPSDLEMAEAGANIPAVA